MFLFALLLGHVILVHETDHSTQPDMKRKEEVVYYHYHNYRQVISTIQCLLCVLSLLSDHFQEIFSLSIHKPFTIADFV